MELPNPNPTFISTLLHHSHNKSKNLLFRLAKKRSGFVSYDFFTNDNNKEVYALHNKNDDDPDADFTQLLMGLCIGLLSRQILITNLIFLFWCSFGDEVFREILLPELPAYGNSIVKVCLNMWVMKQYGVVSSWTNSLSLTIISEIVCLTRKHIPKPVGLTKDAKIVLEMDGELVLLDLETQEFKDLRLLGYEFNFVDSYVESLILLLDKTPSGAITCRGK